MAEARQKRIVLLAAILGSGIVFLDSTIVNVALPAIRTSLHGDLADQQWIVEAYLLTLSALLLIGGSLGDLFGRKRVFTIGVAAFGVCSLLCAGAPSSEVLIAARGVQGIAGAMLVPSTLALIMDNFADHERAAAIGTWTAWAGIATVIGPLGGGALITLASWRWVFAINVAPVVITLALLRKLPSDTRAPGHVDVLGALLAAFGLAGPVFALIEQPQYGWGSPRVAVPLIAGVALLVGFLVQERRAPEPMMPFELFRSRNFTVGNVTTLTLYAGLSIATFFLVLFIQQVGGYTALEAGLSLLPLTILMFLLSKRFGALADRVGPHLFMGFGPIVAAVGLLLLARVGAKADYPTTVFPGVIVFGLGMSATVAPLTAAVLSSVEQGHSGVASGINNAVARVAGLLAIAALGAVVTASFAHRLDHDAAHLTLTAPARAAIARAHTKPFVISTAGVPRAEAATVRAALVDSSVHAFRFGMVISALLAALGGVVALLGIENPHRRVASADCAGGPLAAATLDAGQSPAA
jgi:EmrB/QacA subfamily drug resistance transporter